MALGPTIDALSTEYAGRVNVGKVNVDENSDVSVKYGITSIPCVLFIKNGEVVDKQVGAAPKNVLEKDTGTPVIVIHKVLKMAAAIPCSSHFSVN